MVFAASTKMITTWLRCPELEMKKMNDLIFKKKECIRIKMNAFQMKENWIQTKNYFPIE